MLAAVLLIGISCCKKITGNNGDKAENQQNKSLYQTNWILTKVGSKKVVREQDKKPVTLLLDAESKNASGHAGCNRFNGQIKETKDGISFGTIASTKMMCPAADMSLEESYFRALEKVNNYLITGNELQLRKGETILLVFTAVE